MIATVQGKRISYDILGKQGSPVIFVHGWGGSGESLRALAALASLKHKAILIDLPGFGHSEIPEPEWGVEEYASVITGLLDHLKIKSVTYFGHSFGGSLGIYLTTSTGMIDKLILCDSSYKRNVKKSRVAMAIKQCMPEHKTLRRLFYRIFFRNSDLAKYPHLESNFRRIVTQDLSDFVQTIAVPTLIVWGAEDTVTPVEYARDLHAKIAGSKLAVVPEERHRLPLNNPQKVYEIMKRNKFI